MDPDFPLMLVTLDLGERQRFRGMANTELPNTAAPLTTKMIIGSLARSIVLRVRSSISPIFP